MGCSRRLPPRLFILPIALALAAGVSNQSTASPPTPSASSNIDFNRQILPLLSEHCFACHGPDPKQRKAGLRLDTKDGAFGKLRGGEFAIVPGKPDQSEVVARLTAAEASEIMPPPGKGKPLTAAQVALVKQWIEQGAAWSPHWAFVPPRKSALPKVSNTGWPRNPIDHFILARLESEGLAPSPEAGKTVLVRRLSLDLTGLPPTPAEVDTFVADQSPNAYEKLVDRLLQSPRYGEHLGRQWLDAARYGDTHGLHLDNYREIWPFRDWVINAFNRNMPFNEFVIEQLAGDLLPGASLDQVVATGFTRCHVTTSEGGSIEEEVYVRNVVDQVDTTGTVFLGLSVGCARCHDHKYDPVTQKDYYQLFAYFNSIDGGALDGNAVLPPPVIAVGSPELRDQLAGLKKTRDAIRAKIAEQVAKLPYEEPVPAKNPAPLHPVEHVWIEDDLPAGVKAEPAGGVNKAWTFVAGPAHPVHSGARSVLLKADGLGQVVFTEAQAGLQVGAGDKLFAHVYLDPANPPKEIMLQFHTDGWRHRAYWGDNLIPWGADNTPERVKIGPVPEKGKWVRLEIDAARVGLKPGSTIVGWAFTQHDGVAYWDKAGIVTSLPQANTAVHSLAGWLQRMRPLAGAGLPKGVVDIVKLDPAKLNDAQKKTVRAYFLEHVYPKTRDTFATQHRELADIEKQIKLLEKQIPSTMIFKERATPRPAYILKRGEYTQRGPEVSRGTPAFLPPLPADAPKNRLALARWMVSPQQPLTARVAVNRFWQAFFGTGLVKTGEDFGVQGERPTHPELLDYLAVQFQEDGGDVKKMIKGLVMSAAYRQSSRTTPQLHARDPANRLLARGPRYRLDAEMIRDQALYVSGLLVEKVGGPSVKPPQPGGLWEAVAYPTSTTARFAADTGHQKVHRRSLYTFWKRTSPPPQMSALDAPSREACVVRRERTNTPLQALLLMNETQMIEAARALAEKVMKENGSSAEDRLQALFRHATCRPPDARELAELQSAYKDHLAVYTKDSQAAGKLITVGETKPDRSVNPTELAALTMIANLVLNLDEVLNKG